eukprot:CAMPEP_0197077108 /NCGR_PEP_ID=MMETSP1384-20130603/212450_1 /TAXON_ID=29189 /ORGANISM="Ammonia sp." /LENGTH=1442 /DNA_ID=CAMNT_0042515967 /DNA_START=143 /DNA_END=4471 /DNA_ORIENTATION=-
MDKTGLVFLKLAEVKVGENDLIIQNSMSAKHIQLPMIMNYTALQHTLSDDDNSDFIKGLTPRWILPSLIKLKDNAETNASVFTQVINSTHEASMDLSRSWSYPRLYHHQCYLTRSVMRHLGFLETQQMIGEVVTLNVVDTLTIMLNKVNASEHGGRNDLDQDTEQHNDAVIMITLLYLIANASGVDLYPPLSTNGEDPSNPETLHRQCYINNGVDYVGSESVTKSGVQCQSWFVDTPNNITSGTVNATNLQHNFCRNPDAGSYLSTQPWCYTISYDQEPEKETCAVPHCLADHLQCKLVTHTHYVDEEDDDELSTNDTWPFTQSCDMGIVLSIQYAYLGLFAGDSCDDEVFIEGDACFVNMTQFVYEHCLGKYECFISDLFQNLVQFEGAFHRFENCSLYNDTQLELKFISQIECNFPYEWNHKIYINESAVNYTIAVFDALPWFMLPSYSADNRVQTERVLQAMSGHTYTVDELRWYLLIAMLYNFDFSIDFIVKDIITEPDGKWSDELGGVMLIESQFVQNYIRSDLAAKLEGILFYVEIINYMLHHMSSTMQQDGDTPLERAQQIQAMVLLFMEATRATQRERESNPDQFNPVKRALSQFTLNDYAMFTIINHMERIHLYLQNYNQIRSSLQKFGSMLTSTLYHRPETMDYRAATVTAPILTAMKLLSFMKILLNSILNSMTVIIGILSCIIIYCLMIIDVDNKTFECGVLRSIGMLKRTLIYILNLKSLMFCIPGIVIGLSLSTLGNIPISNLIASFVTIPPQYMLSMKSIAVSSLLFGLFIPIIAGIIPMRKALATTLSNSLNLYFNAVDQVIVQIIYHNEYGLNFATILISLVLIAISFVCLYVIPYSVATENFPLFFTVFDFIFLGLLFGLGIISMTLQNALNQLLCTVLMSIGPAKKLRYLVSKNLHAHSSRNSKTSAMLVLSSAFIVFSGCMIELQSSNLIDLFVVFAGADIVFVSRSPNYVLPEYDVTQLFKSYEPRFSSLVHDYTFVTWEIGKNRDIPNARTFAFGPLGRDKFSAIPNQLVGVQENFCNVAYCEDYLVLSDVSKKVQNDAKYPRLGGALYGKRDPIAGLYYHYNIRSHSDHSYNYLPPKNITTGRYDSRHKRLSVLRSKIAQNATYSNRIGVLTATAMKDACGVDKDIALRINANFKSLINKQRYFYPRYGMSPIIASKVPGFWFSKHAQLANKMSALTTMYEYEYFYKLLLARYNLDLRMLREAEQGDDEEDTDDEEQSGDHKNSSRHQFPFNLVKQKLMIRMSDASKSNEHDRTEIVDLVNSILNKDYVSVTDTVETINGVEATMRLLSILFELVALLTMLLCFFISFISFRQNVYDNIYQFGVLRAIGLDNMHILGLFVAEALIITISSLAMGSLIGCTQSVLITLQSQILTESIFVFLFPTKLYIILVIASFLIAAFSSILPSIILIKTPPSHILRL